MIVAVSVGNVEGDSPSVFVVDTDKVTPRWRAAILADVNEDRDHTPNPTEWESLEAAQVPLPATIDAVAVVYYDEFQEDDPE